MADTATWIEGAGPLIVRGIVYAGAVVLAAALALASASAAGAAVAPSSGPVAGGTSVAVDVPQNDFTQLAAGGHFTVGLTADGAVWAWGDNQFGQLGDGTTVNRSTPVRVALPTGVAITQLAAGSRAAYALTSDGAVYAWGGDSVGQLGDGTTVNKPTPVLAAIPSGVVVTSLTAAYGQLPPGIDVSSVYAVTSTGGLYAWGDNSAGQLGTGTTTSSSTPIPVALPSGEVAVAVAGGQAFSAVLASNGNLYTSGFNSSGQLGQGAAGGLHQIFAAVTTGGRPAGVTFTAVTAGRQHVLALGSDGVLYAWGSNGSGQLGDGTTTNRPTPTPVAMPAGTIISSLTASVTTSYALGSDGSYYVWGNGGQGEYGNGSTPVIGSTPLGVDLGLPAPIARIVPSMQTTDVLLTTGRVYAWGYNGDGEIGNGTTSPVGSPVTRPVEALSPTVVSEVTFAGTPGTGLAVDDPTAPRSATVLTPPHPAGPADVVVVTTARSGGAVSPATFRSGFEYLAPLVAPTITSGAPPDGQVNVPYDYVTTATGAGPITFGVIGALPPGLTLDAVTGELTGTPVTAGSYAFTLTATNSAGRATLDATVTVAAPPATITTQAPTSIPGATTLAFTGDRPALPIGALILGAALIALGAGVGVAHTILRRRTTG